MVESIIDALSPENTSGAASVQLKWPSGKDPGHLCGASPQNS